ncbi:MAG: GldG family protein [Methylacidiphilales bacterium]|nr:GldG family protein [Candidatus Methylacidiphilales bacterium]
MTAKPQSKLQWKLNLAISLFLILVLFVAANGLSYKHFYRKNIAISNYNKLSGMTLNLLKQLPGEVKLVNFASPQSQTDLAAYLLYNDVDALITEYRYNGHNKVRVEKVDPFVDVENARSMELKYKLTEDDNVVIVEYNGQWKALSYRDLATIDSSQAMMGGAPPKVEAFKGEQQITSAIQALVQGKKSRVYFLSGHGEYDIKSDLRSKEGYSTLRAYIERQNADVEKLNLVETGQIPNDADLLVVAGPRSKYNPLEVDLLDKYLQQQGGGKGARLILMLDPDTDTGLENLLKDYGVQFQNDMVMAKIMLPGQVKVLPQAIGTKFAAHPAIDWMRKSGGNLSMGPARSLSVQPADKSKNSTLTMLVQTPEAFWGEMDYKAGAAEYNPGRDLAGPLPVAVAVDTASVSGGQVQLKGDKIVAIGSGSLLMNQLIGQPQVDFFINIMNWMLEGGKPLGIAPKAPQEFTVNISPRDIWTLAGILLLFPVFAGLLAVGLWFQRRN